MKSLFFVCLLLSYSLSLLGQVYIHPQGLALYNQGTNLMERGDYFEAEKVFSEALHTLKEEDVYLKRGIIRLNLGDTVGFCEDMNMAGNKYFGLQASLLFNKICCKSVDTLYFNKDFLPANKYDFRYFEEIKHPKYDSITIGVYHNIKVKKAIYNLEYERNGSSLAENYKPDYHVVTPEDKTTDIISVYEELDTARHYFATPRPPKIMNLTKYNLAKNKMKKRVESQFYHLKIENNLNLTVYFEMYINKFGKVTAIKIIGTYPEIDFNAEVTDLTETISSIIMNKYPVLKPAYFNGKPVDFIALDYVTF